MSETGIMPDAFSSSTNARSENASPWACARSASERLDLGLAREVAGAVAGLLQVQALLEPDEVAVRLQPAVGRALVREADRLLEPDLVRVDAQAREAAGGALGHQHVHELPAARAAVQEARARHHLFHRGREALGAAVPDVVEQRAAADGARVRTRRHAVEVEPVVAVGAQQLRLARVHLREEVALGRAARTG